MKTVRIFRGLLSVILAAALALPCWAFPVNANEVTEVPTEPKETLETAVPTEAAAAVPQETTEPAAETQPAETAPPETAAPETAPAATENDFTQIRQTLVAISFAESTAVGTRELSVQGTVVYANNGLTVLQDRTGGICLTFTDGTKAVPGEVLRITGSRTAGGLTVESCERKGTAELPLKETTLDSAEECVRILVKNATFSMGSLIQGAVTMPVTPGNPEGVAAGDLVDAWGVVVNGWFYAEKVTPIRAAPEELPAVTAVPTNGVLAPGESVGLDCAVEGASIYYALSYDGETYSEYTLYAGDIPVEAGAGCVYVRAYAAKEGSTPGPETEFYFASEGHSGEESTGWNLYFGQLHAHTNISDGYGTPEEAFRYAANVPGLDFFAVTDHSNSFDNGDSGAINADGAAISEEWAAGKAAAAAVTDGDFVGIFGYEMTWQERRQLGHINTFATAGWQTRGQEGFLSLEGYYEALTTAPGSISQFNHPGAAYGYFENFAHYSPKYDAFIHLLEVGSEDGYRAYEYYTRALDKGWHVAPTNNQANHTGTWGDKSSVRTVILAQTLTEESLYDAMRNYRVYATEDSDLEILYYLDGNLMGSVQHTPAQRITVSLQDPTDAALGTVEVIADGGAVIAQRVAEGASAALTIPVSDEYTYYYLRVTQPDGDIAVTAPVWVDLYVDMGIQSFTADTEIPVQGQEVLLTLELYNNENTDFVLETLEFYLDDRVIHSADLPGTVPALDTFTYQLPFTYSGLGQVELRAVATGTAGEVPQIYETTLSLRYQAENMEQTLSAISYVRGGQVGEIYRVKGYVTAGTSNPYNTFPGTIYLQDDTGGIAVVSFTDEGIQVGRPLEVTGYLENQNGNPVLALLSYDTPEEEYFRYVPETMYHRTAMNYETCGGQLLQVEGQVVSLTRAADGKGISRFTLKDSLGALATVQIDDAILSGAYGVNELAAQVKIGCTVRAMGILHLGDDGAPVLRVRNCDEVVYVPPVIRTADPTNPKTGDVIYNAATVLCASTLGLAVMFLIWKVRKDRK